MGGEHADLAFEAVDGAVDVGFLQAYGYVITEVAGGKIIGSIEHDVVLADE